MPNNLTFSTNKSSVRLVQSSRHMKMYDLTKNEVQMLSTLNTQATVAFSIASFLLSQAVGIWGNVGVIDSKLRTPVQEILCAYGIPLTASISVVFFLCGFALLRNKKSILAVVEEETKEPAKKPTPRKS